MWRKLTIDDVRLSLSEDEVQILSGLSIDESKVDKIIQETLDNVADMFRASWSARGYQTDPRDHYVSPGYVEPVLAVTRFHLWTRFPMTPDYSLDDSRKKLYEEAVKLLKDPYLGTEKVDWTDPGLSAYADLSAQTGSSIKVPWMATGYDWRWIG